MSSVTDGGHDIHVRVISRHSLHLRGHLEAIDNGAITFSDGLAERFATVESAFGQR